MSAVATHFLIIMLHGVGSSGDDLAPLANVWHDRLPGAVFVSPNAPSPSSFEENRSSRIKDARASFDATISAIVKENGFADRLDHVALVGFSQGTIMALDAVASGRWPVGAVVGFSGRLASPLPLEPALATPILLIHGSADPVIPVSETTKAAAVLQPLGMKVEMMIIPGLVHTISTNGAEKAGAFLAETLAK